MGPSATENDHQPPIQGLLPRFLISLRRLRRFRAARRLAGQFRKYLLSLVVPHVFKLHAVFPLAFCLARLLALLSSAEALVKSAPWVRREQLFARPASPAFMFCSHSGRSCLTLPSAATATPVKPGRKQLEVSSSFRVNLLADLSLLPTGHRFPLAPSRIRSI